MILASVLQDILANLIDTEINTGAGTAELIFETSGDVEVALFSLQNPAFGASSSGVLTLAGVTLTDADAAGGTVAQASIFDRDGTKQLEMTVAVSGAEIDLSSLAITALEIVDLTALTLAVPAS